MHHGVYTSVDDMLAAQMASQGNVVALRRGGCGKHRMDDSDDSSSSSDDDSDNNAGEMYKPGRSNPHATTAMQESQTAAHIDMISKTNNTRLLVVRSADRDRYLYPTASNFQYQPQGLPKSNKTLHAISMTSLLFPHISTTINARNCMLYISEEGQTVIDPATSQILAVEAPTMYRLKLPFGSFNGPNLAKILSSLSTAWVPVSDVTRPVGTVASTAGTQNTYSWTFYLETGDINLECKTHNRKVHIHCPPKIQRIQSSARAVVAALCPLVTDIFVTNARVVGEHTVRIETTGTKHNIIPHAVLSRLVFKSSTRAGKELRYDRVGVHGICGVEYLIVEIHNIHIDWPNVFDVTLDLVIGSISTLAAESSAWSTLGYDTSNSKGFGEIYVTGMSRGDPALNVNPSFTCSRYLRLAADSMIHFPGGLGWENMLNLNGDVTVTLSQAAAGFSMLFTLPSGGSVTSIVPPEGLYCYKPGYFSSERGLDLRNTSKHVMMRLLVNNAPIGQIIMTGSGKGVSHALGTRTVGRDVFYAQWFIDTEPGVDVIRENTKIAEFSYYRQHSQNTPPSSSSAHYGQGGFKDSIDNLDVELIDSAGYPIELMGADWEFVLTLHYGD